MSARPAIVPSSVSELSHLFVSTALDTWFTENAEAFARDVQINDTVYRRLDPEYYAWLRSRMVLAKTAASAGQIGLDAFDELRQRFNPIHQWAIEHFGEPALMAAVRFPEHHDYMPPVSEEEKQRVVLPECTDRNTVSVATEVVALIDAIRHAAIAVGWTDARLYQTRGSLRFPLGEDYGLVCYLKRRHRIGQVTRESIELIGPPPEETRSRFYNPDVEQPWIKRSRP